MTLIKCKCGRYFQKYSKIIMGEPLSEDGQKDGICVFECPHCGERYSETAETRKLTRMINNEED